VPARKTSNTPFWHLAPFDEEVSMARALHRYLPNRSLMFENDRVKTVRVPQRRETTGRTKCEKPGAWAIRGKRLL
jgi:hypothetical protein